MLVGVQHDQQTPKNGVFCWSEQTNIRNIRTNTPTNSDQHGPTATNNDQQLFYIYIL